MINTPLAKNQIRGDFVFLRADNLRLLFPLDDIVHTTFIDTSTLNKDLSNVNDSAGSTSEYDMCDSVAISSDLTTLSKIPKDRFILVQMNGFDVLLCWNEMAVLTDELLSLTHIPPQFLNEQTPLRTIVTLEGHPAFLCSATNFLSYLFPKKVSVT